MHLALNHKTNKQLAISRIDNFLSELMKKDFPGGVKIKNPKKEWNDSQMNFSFKAKKGLIGVTFNGIITVTEEKIVIDCEVPRIVMSFVDEDEIKKVITDQVNEIFV